MKSVPQTPGTGQGKQTHGVFIVDDHPVVRQGVAMTLGHESDLELVGEAASAAEALAAIEKTCPDVAIVDLTLKDSNGLDLVKDIRIRFPDIRVLVLSMRDESFYAERCLRAGARGYVSKDEGPRRLVEAIRQVLRGEIAVSEHMASSLMARIVPGAIDEDQSSIQSLTDRELEVFELIGQGLATREIARRLHISPKTVDSHREHIKAKLQVDTASDLLKHAIQWMDSLPRD